MVAKFLVTTALIALLAFICGLFLPWWSIVGPAFVVSALIPQKPWLAFFSGFLALLLLWGGLAVAIDVPNKSILSTRIADIFHLGSPILVIVATGLTGALVGGGGSLTASFLYKRPAAKAKVG